MADKPVVGVDVAKGWLDMCVSGACERIDNTAAAVLSWLDRVRPGLVACEPTGGYERVLLDALGTVRNFVRGWAVQLTTP